MSYEENQHNMKIIFNSFASCFNCKQKDNENFQDYAKRFKLIGRDPKSMQAIRQLMIEINHNLEVKPTLELP